MICFFVADVKSNFLYLSFINFEELANQYSKFHIKHDLIGNLKYLTIINWQLINFNSFFLYFIINLFQTSYFLEFSMSSKPGTPSNLPSKSVIFSWVKQICPDSPNRLKVQQLGSGVIYCRILNHYFPGTISANRINMNPKNQYQYGLNLKLFQNALTTHKLNLPFDVSKISKSKFLENWGLINNLYRHLVTNNEQNVSNANYGGNGSYLDDSKSIVSYAGKFTPKRSFQHAFNEQRPTQINNYRQHQIVNNSSSGNFNKPQNLIGNNSYLSYNQEPNSNTAQQSFQSIKQPLINNQNYSNKFSSQNSNSRQALIQNKIQQGKCFSVGKLYVEPTRSTSLQGKYSVNSHMFRNNYDAVIDRVKEILLKASHDVEKIRQIKMLLNIPLNEVKIEQQENQIYVKGTSAKKDHSKKQNGDKIQTKESIESQEQTKLKDCTKTLEFKQNSEVSKAISLQGNKQSQSLSNISSESVQESSSKKIPHHLIPTLSSGKKIKNNFYGQGSIFRK